MINVVVEERKAIKTLKVGDILIEEGQHLCIVLEDKFTSRTDCKYKVARIDKYNDSIRMSEGSLEELTDKAIRNNYKLYSQDDYELVIRRKE